MATCKECLHYDICKEHDKLILTVNTFFELKYQNAVEQFCKHFKSMVDIAEIKHGLWLIHRYDEAHGSRIYCSCCGASHVVGYKWKWTINTAKPFRYCSWCGVRMEGLKPDDRKSEPS